MSNLKFILCEILRPPLSRQVQLALDEVERLDSLVTPAGSPLAWEGQGKSKPSA
jgi:hypothetical protein